MSEKRHAEYLRLAQIQAVQRTSAMKAEEWLQRLGSLDATSEPDLFEFLSNTYVGSVEAIPLGSHEGVSYFVQTGVDSIPQRSSISLAPLDRMRGVSNAVKSYEFQLLPDGSGSRPDLRYGFGLGSLRYRKEDSSFLENAGFFVVFNILDKSVWIMVDMIPFQTADTEFHTEPLPIKWGMLQKDEEKQIGLMRVSQHECTFSMMFQRKSCCLFVTDEMLIYPL
jgi:hypothetical protein